MSDSDSTHPTRSQRLDLLMRVTYTGMSPNVHDWRIDGRPPTDAEVATLLEVTNEDAEDLVALAVVSDALRGVE